MTWKVQRRLQFASTCISSILNGSQYWRTSLLLKSFSIETAILSLLSQTALLCSRVRFGRRWRAQGFCPASLDVMEKTHGLILFHLIHWKVCWSSDDIIVSSIHFILPLRFFEWNAFPLTQLATWNNLKRIYSISALNLVNVDISLLWLFLFGLKYTSFKIGFHFSLDFWRWYDVQERQYTTHPG